ncbi:hypothetical protein PLESTB_001499700 [Pleodorina starrii]|uniref:Uncharacterized protein n=1 Tax=Pleodorina starrii TaxID=330485 RepID=A0A9W6BWU7_9CHLO|nr:hypothetical protein PLESTM_000665700 [Pleodorina starrii]GLC59553.1 hypothetical protein PLESTB_001499700 [Pleodorina starrii]GLC67793.1 hypothetical protein PLESTF_000608000 [Pleodorina starrii]
MEIRTALLVETINVAVWMLAAFLIYQVAARTGTHWLLLPPLREACKGTSNVISYVIELWI